MSCAVLNSKKNQDDKIVQPKEDHPCRLGQDCITRATRIHEPGLVWLGSIQEEEKDVPVWLKKKREEWIKSLPTDPNPEEISAIEKVIKEQYR